MSELEPNNTRARANALALGTPMLGQLSSSKDQDWYAVTATTTGGLTLNWTGPTSYYSDNLSIYNASGVLLGNYQTAVNGAYSFAATANQTYYVGVSSAGSNHYNSAQYSLSVEQSNIAPTGEVKISGTPEQGQILTASNTIADLDGLGAITYQWQTSLDGKTWANSKYGSMIALVSGDIGIQYRVIATYTDGHGTNESVASVPTSSVIADILDSTTTTISLGIGQTLTSTIGSIGDRDWIKVQLVAGTTYKFELLGADSNGGTLTDPFLKLLNANGTVLRANDNGTTPYSVGKTPHLHDSQLIYTPEASESFFLEASQFGVGTGTYSLTASEFSSDNYIKSLLYVSSDGNSYRSWNAAGILNSPVTLTYSFLSTLPVETDSSIFSFVAMSIIQKVAVRQILDQIHTVANITFSEVAAGQGNIQFGTTYQTNSSGFTIPNPSEGQLTLAYVAINNSSAESLSGNTTYSVGSYYFDTVIHEIGHALGLKHPGNYNAASTTGAPTPYLPTSEDQSPNTVMTYNNDTSKYLETTLNAYLKAKTDMAFDIAALQYLYGANTQTNTANDIYTFADSSMYCIWDAGGTDTIDASAQIKSVTLELQAGEISYQGILGVDSYGAGLIPQMSIAFNTTIENAIGGGGNDLIVGNQFANTFSGGAGDDTIDGGAGNDNVNGGTGNDIMFGGAGDDYFDLGSSQRGGNDTMAGGIGDDVYVIDSLLDVIVELANEGSDLIWSTFTYDLTSLTNVEKLSLFGTADVNSKGNALDNTLRGNDASNTLDGGAGSDTVTGGLGADTFVVGAGTDTITDLGNGTDVLTVATGAIANATIYAAWTATAATANSGVANISTNGLTVNLAAVTAGTRGFDVTNTGGAAALTGSGWADTLMGGVGNDTLTGGAGDDSLNGSTGADTMLGGAGNDTYVVDNAGDVVYESTTASSGKDARGTDTVQSSVSYTLGQFVENLALTGAAAISATGNTLANTLVGNGAANTLNGGAGNDTLTGGLGADTFVVGSGTDTITDLGNGADILSVAAGAIANATVYAAWTATAATTNNGTANIGTNGMAVSLAALTTGTAGYSITNTGAATTLTGSALADTLNGGVGNDTLNGGLGLDMLIGGNGADLLYGGIDTVKDIFKFNALSDSTTLARDKIYNFISGTDKLDFSGIDAKSKVTGDQAFKNSSIGTKATNYSVWANVSGSDLIISADTDGISSTIEFQLQIMGVTKLAYADVVL